MPQCWRITGYNIESANNYELFICATTITVQLQGADEALIFADGIGVATEYLTYYPSVAYSVVTSDTYTPGLSSSGKCTECLLETYDCINGTCTPSTTYNTPGIYASLSLCQSTCGAENVNFTTINAPIFTGLCDANNNPILATQQVQVIQGTETSELLKFTQIAQIQGAATCDIPVAAIPQGWLIRPEHDRPQCVYQLAQCTVSGTIIGAPKYPITVPHHVATKPNFPIGIFQRGNWETIYVLNDNSKIVLHTVDERTGQSVLAQVLQYVDPNYKVDAYQSKSSQVISLYPLSPIYVKHRLSKYYSKGVQNGLPDWVQKW